MNSRAPQLPDRFAAVLALTPPGAVVADIGFDHGDFLVLAAERGHRIIGVERQMACLERFPARHRRLGDTVRERMTLRCGDGPDMLREDDRIDTITIAGLGERTIVDWAQRAPSTVNRIVACPSDMRGTLRPDMRAAGFRIVDERMAEGRGRLYPVVAWERGEEDRADDARFHVGPVLFAHAPEHLLRWLRWRLERLKGAMARLRSTPTPTDSEGIAFSRWVASLQTAHDRLATRAKNTRADKSTSNSDCH